MSIILCLISVPFFLTIYSVRDIVRASKKTEPFKNAEQYSVLKLKKSAEYENLMQDVKSDPDFMRAIEEAVQTLKQTNS